MKPTIKTRKVENFWGRPVNEYCAVKEGVNWATIFKYSNKKPALLSNEKDAWIVQWAGDKEWRKKEFEYLKEAKIFALQIANSKI